MWKMKNIIENYKYKHISHHICYPLDFLKIVGIHIPNKFSNNQIYKNYGNKIKKLNII